MNKKFCVVFSFSELEKEIFSKVGKYIEEKKDLKELIDYYSYNERDIYGFYLNSERIDIKDVIFRINRKEYDRTNINDYRHKHLKNDVEKILGIYYTVYKIYNNRASAADYF